MTKLPNQKLTPLVDDPTQPSYVRELIEAGRTARVSGYDFQAGLAAHLARVDSSASMPEWAKELRPSSSTAAGAGAASTGLATWMTITTASLVGVAVVAVTAAVMVSSRDQRDAAPEHHPAAPQALPLRRAPVPASATAPVTDPAPEEAAAEDALPRAGVEPRPRVGRPISRSGLRVTAGRPLSAGAVPFATPPAPSHGSTAPASEPAVSAATSSDTASVPSGRQVVPTSVRAEPTTAEPAASAASAQDETAAPRPVVRAPQDDARLEREMGMLAMTQRVLLSDPARALSLAQQGEAEFPGSMFTQERQQLLLLALVKLGRLDEAKQLAKPYLARFPHGPYSDRVRRALASSSVPR